MNAMRDEFLSLGGEIHFNSKVNLTESHGEIHDSSNQFTFKHVVNTAGAQADRISRSVGVGTEYAMLPFMAYTERPVKRIFHYNGSFILFLTPSTHSLESTSH